MLSKTVFNVLIDYIRERVPQNITMDELQRKSGYSKRQLSRIFIQNIGLTPSDYVDLLRLYRILLELKFTQISIHDLCMKYGIKDIRNFQNRLNQIIGADLVDVYDFRRAGKLNFNFSSTNINLPKRYLKCKLTSLFNYHLPTKGVKHTAYRSLDSMFTSHFTQKENIINDFCHRHLVNRSELWCCSKFSPFNSTDYKYDFIICAPDDLNIDQPHEQISLQGDYLMFTWVGKKEDTYPRVSNIYDNFFLKYGLTRKEGWDLERRRQLSDVRGYFVHFYYIPVAIDTAILDIVDYDD